MTQKEATFNKKLSQARRLIENTFGLLKGRFWRMQKLEYTLSMIPKLIITCCIIHNIAILNKEEFSWLSDSLSVDEKDELDHKSHPTPAARAKRDLIADSLM